MSVQVEQISPFQKRLQFTIPSPEVQDRLDAAFRTLSVRVRLPGFRPGKAPRKVLESRYGRQIRGEVASELINFKFREAALDMPYIGQPEVQTDELRDGSDFTFSVTVQVKPEVGVEGYKGIQVDYPTSEVPDTAVESQIQQRLVGSAKVVEVEDERGVQEGDLVLTRVVALLDGEEKELEGGTMVRAGGDRYYPGIHLLLAGLKKGESATGTVTIGEANTLPSHKGQDVQVRVEVVSIQTSQVPALTDEVATELGYEGGVEAMRAAIRMKEQEKADEAARNVARVNLLRTLISLNPVSVPPAMVDSHVGLLKEELRIQNAYRGRDPRTIRYSDAQEADLRERATFAARAALLLESVARIEGIEVTDADLDAKYQEIADMRGQRVEAIRGYFAKDNAVGELQKRLLEERTLEWLLEHAELNYVNSGGADLAAAVDAALADAAEHAPATEGAATEGAPTEGGPTE